VIPLKDYNPTRNFPLITILIIVANVVAFVFDLLTGSSQRVITQTPLGAVESVQFVGGLTAHHALVPARLVANFLGHWSDIFSSMFLHGNWLHIGSNMLYLWIFGNNIEDRLGPIRFTIFYLACGLAAAAAQVLVAPFSTVPMIGASGAVAGVMGAYLILYPRARVLTIIPLIFFFPFVEVPAFLIIGYWGLLQFISAVVVDGASSGGGIAYAAHVGGFVAGILLIFLFGGRRLLRDRDSSPWL
jgi:membrane associated rhomboid family serine protease